jgi:hypothetical protein
MLAVLRDHGAAVRSAVLDSPLPASVRYDDASVGHFAQALDPPARRLRRAAGVPVGVPGACGRASTRRSRGGRPPTRAHPCESPVDSSPVPLALRGAALARLVALDNGGRCRTCRA